MSVGERRERFERAVIERMKASGYLEVEIRVECLQREGDGYADGSIDAYWHFWNAALLVDEYRHGYTDALDATKAAVERLGQS